jgi:hypothetical protein
MEDVVTAAKCIRQKTMQILRIERPVLLLKREVIGLRSSKKLKRYEVDIVTSMCLLVKHCVGNKICLCQGRRPEIAMDFWICS